MEDYKMELTKVRGKKFDILELATSMIVKMTKSTPNYTKAPRWEREGTLYKADAEGDVNAKYAMTLLGDPTIFLESTEEVAAIFESRDQIHVTDFLRLLAHKPRINSKKNYLVRFIW